MRKLLLVALIFSSFISNGQTDFYNRNREIMDSMRALLDSVRQVPIKTFVFSRNDSVFGAKIITEGDTIFTFRYMQKNWDRLNGKPSTFTPATHSHVQSDITNLSTDLSGKQATITTGTTSQYFKGDLSLGTYTGYSINVQALTSSPTDGQTVYFGMLPKAPTTTAATSKVYVRQAGTITAAEIYCYSGTAGTNESWSLYIRVNNTTDNLIATVSANTSERIFTNSSLSISLAAGDYFEIKGVQPTWATNPLTTIYGGYVRIN